MATLRELKGRIGSVASSEKITGAMKMISSAKMHKAEGDLRRLLPFRNQIETIIGNLLSADAEFSSPLTNVTKVEKVAVAVFGSDDGLCGAYNVNTVKFLADHIKALRNTYGDSIAVDIYPIGKKMAKAVERLASPNIKIVATEANSKSTGEQVADFKNSLQKRFTDGEVNRVDLVYMHFLTAGRQRAKADVMLPMSPDNFSADKAKNTARPYIFEPDAATIFSTALPMYLLSLMQEVFCENRASEQAARVMAMQSANDNAKKLLEQLQLEYNKLRQQGITNELLDIVGGQVKD